MLRFHNISKSFGGTVALRDVSLDVQPGRVHGLLGENGAGKSTLMNILFGLVAPDSGSIALGGRALATRSPAAARRAGIGMVHQHFKLVGTLTVLENFSLAVGRGIGLVPRAALRQRLEILGAKLGGALDPERFVESLSVGQQQRLEIIKALAAGGADLTGAGSRVLILDEPTAVLTPQEFADLAGAIRTIAAAGTAVIFISHKLAEVRTVCDELSILRRGRLVFTGAAGTLSADEIAEKMVGAKVESPGNEARAAMPEAAPVLLEVSRLIVSHGAREVLRDVSLQVRAGEIVGIAGVDGNGQSELVRAIVGTEEIAGGEIRIDGEDVTGAPVRRRIEKMAYIPEDRQRQALVLPLSITENLMLKLYRGLEFGFMGFIRRGRWDEHARGQVAKFDIRAGGIDDPAASLSGGNQQKVVLARELGRDCRVVLAVNPTRGLDVGATAFVMRRLLAARNAGAAVLLVHSDLDELLAISDRILVMFGGTLRESTFPAAGKDAIGRMMLGLDATAAAPANGAA